MPSLLQHKMLEALNSNRADPRPSRFHTTLKYLDTKGRGGGYINEGQRLREGNFKEIYLYMSIHAAILLSLYISMY